MWVYTPPMRLALLPLSLIAAALATPAQSQWQILPSPTTANLRGIHNVGNGVAWASGSDGAVLSTTNDGKTWQLCATPPNAEKLDFRGIQAFDASTAIVMSSGKGDLSRLYKTTDACRTWTLLFTNPDPDGFWDALIMESPHNGWLLGDPVDGSFVIAQSYDSATRFDLPRPVNFRDFSTYLHLEAAGRGAFAASNSSLAMRPFSQPVNPCTYPRMWFGTSGPGGAKVFRLQRVLPQCSDYSMDTWMSADVPLSGATASSGVFSLAPKDDDVVIAVGGDYTIPNDPMQTAALTTDGGKTWLPAQTPPHGYRSSVAYSPATKTWVTVGPNGTDMSTDDGRNWRALHPTPTEPPDADKNWNALSLPFVVGPHGRIGKLRPSAFNQAGAAKQ